jgi:hypothetical protein
VLSSPQQRSRTHTPLFQCFAEGDRHRCRRHVAVALHVDINTFHRHTRFFGDRFDDSQIGLMGYHQVDVLRREADARQGALARRRHALHGAFEDFLPFELPVRYSIQHAAIRVIASPRTERGRDRACYLRVVAIQRQHCEPERRLRLSVGVGPADTGPPFTLPLQ